MLGAKQNIPGRSITDYIRKRRTVDRRIWEDLFVPYLDDSNAFKTAIHDFIEGRNHVAHSKVLSQSACQVILLDFEKAETGIEILDDQEIENWFDEELYTIFDSVYQRSCSAIC